MLLLGTAAAQGAPPKRPAPRQPAIRVLASAQSADGLTENDMDQNFLSNLEAYTVERQVANSRRVLESNGVNAPMPRPTSSALYVMSGGRKYAVVRTTFAGGGGKVYSAQIMGIVGDQMRRVICISQTGEVPITYGVCADKIQETFGSRL